MADNLTINEALIWIKTLRSRHAELIQLRDANANRETRYYGTGGDKQITKEPVYDVKKLDKLITRVAREIRLVDTEIKAANALTTIDMAMDESALGEVE